MNLSVDGGTLRWWGKKRQRKAEFSTNRAVCEEMVLDLHQTHLAQCSAHELALLTYTYGETQGWGCSSVGEPLSSSIHAQGSVPSSAIRKNEKARPRLSFLPSSSSDAPMDINGSPRYPAITDVLG